MSMLLPSFMCTTALPRRRMLPPLKIRAQSKRDDGRSSNRVDSNMKLLRERIVAMRAKERLHMSFRQDGWDYTSNHIHKPKKEHKYQQTIALICGTMCFPILIGTTFLCIVSVLAHLNL